MKGELEELNPEEAQGKAYPIVTNDAIPSYAKHNSN